MQEVTEFKTVAARLREEYFKANEDKRPENWHKNKDDKLWLKERERKTQSIFINCKNTESLYIFVNKNKRPVTNADKKARRFMDMVASGVTPALAVRAVDSSSTVRKLVGGMTDKDAKAKLLKLLERGNYPAEIRKAMVRQTLDNMVLEHGDGNIKSQKVALAAAKLISQDPEVGLNTPPVSGGVTIDMGKFGELLDRMTPIKGLEGLVQKEEENIIDAEIENDG